MKKVRTKPLTPLEEAQQQLRLLEYELAVTKSARDALKLQVASMVSENEKLRRRYEELCDDVFRPGFRPYSKSFAGRVARRRKPTGG